jgi:ornithine carbamoyltransferase
VLDHIAARHFLSLAGTSPDELEALLATAAEVKADPQAGRDALAGRSVLLHFAKPSTRTRISFAAAIARLGGTAIVTTPAELQLDRGESIADTARVVSRYCAAIVVRGHAHAELEELAWFATAPVVNALTDRHHPCQALADLMTLQERFGSLAGLAVAYVGDGGNVAHSLIEGAALAGIELRVATPAALRPDPGIVADARAVASATGGGLVLLDDPAAAVDGADAVYTDVHVSMGEEHARTAKLAALARYRVDEALLARARPGAVFMHCLPAHRGEEVTAAVIDGPQSVVFDQAENRLHTAAAVLLQLAA